MPPDLLSIATMSFAAELQKQAAKEELQKQAIFETMRVGLKAAKQALFGGKKLSAAPGVFHAERNAAVASGDELMGALKQRGLNIHRARVKSPESIQAGGHTKVPDDLLGMQAYAKSPADVGRHLEALRGSGFNVQRSSAITRPGYHGVNVKGDYKGVPAEIQFSPGRMSNAGQIMEHSLAYKPKTEAPYSNFIDRWFGKKVAPKMVNSNWMPTRKGELTGLGVSVK